MRNLCLRTYLLHRHLLTKEKLATSHNKCSNLSSSKSFGQPAAETHPHLVRQGEVTPGVKQDEYQARRKRIVELACNNLQNIKDHILIFPASPRMYMTYDIPYPFRQNTEFLYLSGFQEPDSVLILHTKKDKQLLSDYKSVLFVPKRDQAKELWDGPRSGIDGALSLTQVDETHNIENLEDYLSKYCKAFKNYALWYNFIKPIHQEHDVKVISEFMKEDRHRCIENTVGLCSKMRLLKSPAEISLMKESADIASQAFIEVMKFSKPGVNEAHLYAKMDFECRIRDAEFLAYPPVVAGGNRANTIHYINNNQIIRAGELVLMDAGCEFHGYTSDITRTWPVSGKFSPSQRRLYDALLRVQEKCIQLCSLGRSLNNVYREMLGLIGQELQMLGIISPNLNNTELLQKSREFCPHHVSHYLGMDVHDTADMSRNLPLHAGMIVTVEPGLYFPTSNTTIPKEYRGLGIRIEDDILITDSGPVVLSHACPKYADDIEQLMATKEL